MKKAIMSLHFSVIALILFLLFVFNFVAFSFSGVITQYICGFGIDYNSEAAQQARTEGAELAVDICENGFTLLKNENNALPLTAKKVNVFGWGSSDKGFMYIGGGSGEGGPSRIPLYEGLRNSGLELNEELVQIYNSDPHNRLGQNGLNTSVNDYYRLYEPDIAEFGGPVLERAKEFSDTALIFISRRATEGYDLTKYQYDANGKQQTNRTHSQISLQEEALINFVEQNFGNVVVILNSLNIMETGFLDNELVDAALSIYGPGTSSTVAIGNVLQGKATPSGHLVDTMAYDFTTANTYFNSGYDDYGVYINGAGRYLDYIEGVYLGYAWYETADAEGFWDGFYAKSTWGIENGYEDVVQYPFGYGLSYTDFEWTLTDVSLADGSALTDPDAQLTFKVFVQNVGETYSGKDVVQLYYSAPYTRGGIEKPSIRLGAYAKTAELKPGEGEELTLTLKVRDMASYDCYDANNNGFMGYELESGKYTVSLRTDVHTPADVQNTEGGTFEYTVPTPGYRYETDDATGTKVTNQFTTYTNAQSGASSTRTEPALGQGQETYSIDGSDCEQNIVYMTRADFEGTFCHVNINRSSGSAVKEKTFPTVSPKATDDSMPETASTATNYQLDDMVGLSYDDPKWDALVSQLSIEEMGFLVSSGGYGTCSLESINKPHCIDLDGPSGLNTTITTADGGLAVNYPSPTVIASTWDWKLAYEYGVSVGKEADALDVDGWYAPGCNMHRSPLCGRNFEYYSEDPLVSGLTCAYTVLGAKQNGLYAYVKHFVACDSCSGGGGMFRWMSEQTLREIYLKPYELAVKVGGAVGIMTSVDRIGPTRTTGSYRLLTTVLRDEWGFRGCVISDYYQSGYIHDADEFIRAGNDLILDSNGTFENKFDDRESASAIIALKKSVKNILYSYVTTEYTKATAQGLDLSSVIGTKTEVYPWWIWILAGLDVIIVGGCALWGGLVIKKSRRRSS